MKSLKCKEGEISSWLRPWPGGLACAGLWLEAKLRVLAGGLETHACLYTFAGVVKGAPGLYL